MVEDPIHPCAGSSQSKMAVWLRETREQLDGIHYSGVNSSANVVIHYVFLYSLYSH